MKKFDKRWLWLLLPVVLFGTLWGLLRASSYDNVERISLALLYQPRGQLNERAFNAAMNARFPAGTKTDELLAFIKSLGGQCHTKENGGLTCSLDESGSFCVAGKIGIDARLSPDGTIKSIAAKSYVIGC